MREIKFRALTNKKKGRKTKWVYGYYSADCGWPGIIGEDGREDDVDEKTVGQYTGLKDKDGREVYEGDIIYFQAHEDDDFANAIVAWSEVVPGFKPMAEGFVEYDTMRVVGNIYENPDLLEVPR